MKEKYLPIGTVCTIKGNTNKIMIIGYLPIDYNGNLNVYDYRGCVYPNGLFASSSTLSFNHNDIQKVDFMGYESELSKNLSSNLLSASVVDMTKEKTRVSAAPKYLFDENGVIIMDGNNTYGAKKEVKEVSNPFKMNYETKEVVQENNRFKFDENGVIIEDASSTKPVEQKATYKFDENGVIIEDGVQVSPIVNIPSPYKFDENGVIVEDNNMPKAEQATYKFDKNGVIIEDGTVSQQEVKTAPKYKFDENGVIIEEL